MPNPPITKITDQLYLGDGKSSRDPEILGKHNITAVPWYKKIIVEGNHLFIPCEDSMTMNLLPELANICDFIKKHLDSGSVLVHCDRGVSRSVTALIAYLMQTHQYDLAAALAFVGEKRKIRPNNNFKEQLEVWGAVGGNIWAAPGVPKAEYAAYLANRKKRLQEAGLTGNEPIGITSL
ncbi:phosphatases II [Byssothecium circinans]|uniref:protein-tyrosine-phosphatase n=1 Tax=Byssothecium circinans TaxID=147558 RepID=A0A6A5TN04_9PLEO|nr:phosphatases II [Byssothecium circinans]